jgi:hypothetical protein
MRCAAESFVDPVGVLDAHRDDAERPQRDEDDDRVDDEHVDRQTKNGVEHGSVRRRDAASLPWYDDVRAPRLHESRPRKVPDMPEQLITPAR